MRRAVSRSGRHELLIGLLIVWIVANVGWHLKYKASLQPQESASPSSEPQSTTAAPALFEVGDGGSSTTSTSKPKRFVGRAAGQHHVHHPQQHHNKAHRLEQHANGHAVNDDDVGSGEGEVSAHDDSREDDDSSDDAATVKPWREDELPKSKGASEHAAMLEPVVFDARRTSMSFMIIGDWGGPGRDPQRQVAAAMDEVAKRDFAHSAENPLDFVISTGDNMYEDGVASVHDVKFKRNFENVYTQPTLQCRWYQALGNHDRGAHGVIRDVIAQVNYTKLSKRWFLPSTHYAQRLEVPGGGYSVELFVLDTYDVSPRLTRMTSKQLRWFDEALSNSTADWKIVVGHRPLFSAGSKHGSSPWMQKKLLPTMTKHRVAVYFSGDDHDLQVLREDGIWFAVSGGGARAKNDLKPSGVKQTVFQAGVHGFMHMLVQNATHAALSVYNKNSVRLFATDIVNRP